jgi:hypothetical protein
MNIIYAQEDFTPEPLSIFLVGPTPRNDSVVFATTSWRPKALEILEHYNFQGQVLVPEGRNGKFNDNYLGQVEWEFKGLENAGIICAWVPRNMETMPALTTNIEFGRYVGSGRLLYGRPNGAPHTGYLDWLYTKLTGLTPHTTLEELLFVADCASKIVQNPI